MGLDTGLYSWGSDLYRPEKDRPVRDAQGRLQNYGFYLAAPVQANLLHNELRGAYVLSERAGLQVEAAYAFRSFVPGVGDPQVQHWVRVGIAATFRDRYTDQQLRTGRP